MGSDVASDKTADDEHEAGGNSYQPVREIGIHRLLSHLQQYTARDEDEPEDNERPDLTERDRLTQKSAF